MQSRITEKIYCAIYLNALLAILIASCNRSPNNSKGTVNDRKEHVDSSKVKKAKSKTKDSLYSIVRIDKRSQRVFVVIDSAMTNNLKKIGFIIGQIKKAYQFDGQLNISFVSDSKYAGYKDELEMSAGISYWEFYNHYLGEYDQLSKEYWTFPALPEKKEKYQID